MSKFTCVAVIQNQAPYIVEWVAHHLSLGVTDFVLCFYGSSDRTAKVTRRLAAMGYVANVKIKVENDDPRASALEQIATLDEVTQADWIGLVDVDQFINIHQGFGNIKELVASFPEAHNAIQIESSWFGSGSSEDLLAQINRYSRDPKGIDITSLVQDKSILRYATWFEKYQRILMSDRRLKLAHENGLSWHKARQ